MSVCVSRFLKKKICLVGITVYLRAFMRARAGLIPYLHVHSTWIWFTRIKVQGPQSRQSAWLFLQSSELSPPPPPPPFPHSPASVSPSLWFRGRWRTRLPERGWGVPIRMRGQTLLYLYYVLCVRAPLCKPIDIHQPFFLLNIQAMK